MTDLGWIVIPNWRRFQHYEARNPIWVKTYTELLSSDEYLDLPPRTRSLLHGLWLLYASSSCAVRAHTRRLSRALNQQVTRSDLETLVNARFIEIAASKPLSEREAPASKTLRLARADAGSQDEEAETEEQPPAVQPLLKPLTEPEQPVPGEPNESADIAYAATPARNGHGHEREDDDIPFGTLDPHAILHQFGHTP